ncbi:MAG: hypothetical protein WDZ41_04505 [Candidatus Babeliales bacterium]
MKNCLKNHLKILFFCILSSFVGVQAVFERGEVGIFEGLKFDPIEQASAFESHVKEGLFEAERQEEIYREVSKELPAYEKELKSHSELTDKFSDKYVEYVDLYSNLQDQQERGLSDEVINQTRKNIEKTAAELEEYKQQIEAKSIELDNLIKRYRSVLKTSLEKPFISQTTEQDVKNLDDLLKVPLTKSAARKKLSKVNKLVENILNAIKNRGTVLLGEDFDPSRINEITKTMGYRETNPKVESATNVLLSDFYEQKDLFDNMLNQLDNTENSLTKEGIINDFAKRTGIIFDETLPSEETLKKKFLEKQIENLNPQYQKVRSSIEKISKKLGFRTFLPESIAGLLTTK